METGKGRVGQNMHFGLKRNPETDSLPNHFKLWRGRAQMHGLWVLLQWGRPSLEEGEEGVSVGSSQRWRNATGEGMVPHTRAESLVFREGFPL